MTKFIQLNFSKYLFLILFLFSVVSFMNTANAIQNEVVNVGIFNNKPMCYIDDNGNPAGIFVSVIEYAADKEGWKLNYVYDSFSSLRTKLEKGEIDILLSTALSEERKKLYSYNHTDVFNNWAEVYVQPKSKIRSLLNLKGKRVATLKKGIFSTGSEGIITLDKKFHLNINFLFVEDYKSGLKAVKDGSADAAVVNRLVGEIYENEFKLQESGIVFSPVIVRFALNKKSSKTPFLIKALDTHLDTLIQDHHSIYHRTIDEVFGSSAIGYVNPKWLLAIVVVVFLSVLFFIGFILILNKQVNNKTKALLQANNNLEANEIKYKNLFIDAPIAYQSLDDEGYILQVNKQWLTLTGCDESVIGKYIGEFVSPKTIPSLDKNFPKFKQKGNINDAEWEILNRVTGGTTPIRVYGNISYNDDNEISHTNCLLYDLTTEKKQATAINEAFEAVMHTFVNILETKDVYTAGHSKRVATYSKEIAREMGCSEEDIDILYRAGQLHDIGKIITPESILLKPGKFNDDEYALMKEHAQSGYDILNQLKDYQQISSIMKHHHERYDGKGYPDGLSSNTIPKLSRIMTICDAFDAMTTNRVYKPRLAINEAIEEIKKCSGTQFDPKIIPYAVAYFESLDEIKSTKSIPDDVISRHRFAYFFKDNLTKAYNGSYLEIFLTNNNVDKLFNESYLVNLHGLHQYNHKMGWKEGDKVLKQLVNDLSKAINSDVIFRLHGDKFIILVEDKLPQNQIIMPPLEDVLYITQHYQKIEHDKIYSIDMLLDNFYQK